MKFCAQEWMPKFVRSNQNTVSVASLVASSSPPLHYSLCLQGAGLARLKFPFPWQPWKDHFFLRLILLDEGRNFQQELYIPLFAPSQAGKKNSLDILFSLIVSYRKTLFGNLYTRPCCLLFRERRGISDHLPLLWPRRCIRRKDIFTRTSYCFFWKTAYFTEWPASTDISA